MSEGLHIDRLFSADASTNGISSETRTSRITDPGGEVVFEMDDVTVPSSWSQMATDVLASKYFRKAGVPSTDDGREHDAEAVFHRMAHTWKTHGLDHGYFDSEDSASAFYDEVCCMLRNQMMAPNSPQWFNTGLYHAYGIEGVTTGQHWRVPDEGGDPGNEPIEAKVVSGSYIHPQISACFIQRVTDSLLGEQGIFDLLTREAAMFKFGSGTGTNFSSLRAAGERLSSGGQSSGLMSWLAIADTAAGAVKSGGTTRRAAKMVCLDIDHPDVMRFISLKAREEIKVRALVEGFRILSGEDPDVRDFAERTGLELTYDFNGEAYATVNGQNANMSIRIPAAFMRHVAADPDFKWPLIRRTDGAVSEEIPCGDMWDLINECSWRCADPGVQFDDTINDWHTCAADGRINASNPCCFVGETLVDTSEGRIRFDRLCEMYESGDDLPLVWAFSRSQKVPVLRPIIRVWKAGNAHELVEVLTDKGIRLRCTPEHRFLLRDGRYIRAKDLRAGDRLRKIGRFVNEQRGNRRYLNHKATSASGNGTTSQARYMWEQVHGPIDVGWDVHHVNGDATDDRLSNFELVWCEDHKKYHADGSRNPRYIEVGDSTLVDVWESIEKLPRLTHKKATNRVTPARWNAYIRANNLRGVIPTATSPSLGGRIRGMSWDEFSAWIEENRSLVNDKVHSVRPIEPSNPVSVFDMEVQGTHNFAVTSEEDTGRHTIVAHNSEYMFLDNTACNLASLNVLKFYDTSRGTFDYVAYAHAIRITTIILDISVGLASYPGAAIAERSYAYRTLGLGYANVGALLMSMGIPYDSDKGRNFAGLLASILTGVAYDTSGELAEALGAFPAFEGNAGTMRRVLQNHAACNRNMQYIDVTVPPKRLDPAVLRRVKHARQALDYAMTVWDSVLRRAAFRNAQVTCIAPTGTIGFVMDCDTTGVEPDFALVKFKKLAGGGGMKIVNRSVVSGLRRLQYTQEQIADIEIYIAGSGHLHVPVSSGTPTSVWDFLIASGYSEDEVRRANNASNAFTLRHVLPDGGEMARRYDATLFAHADLAVCGHGTVDGAPHIDPEHYSVFDCANAPDHSERVISPQGHILMMAQVQPFISGAISKTINLPENATREDVAQCHLSAWGNGLKAVAIYRDRCKHSQPLTARKGSGVTPAQQVTREFVAQISVNPKAKRERLPQTRRSITHKLQVGPVEGYITCGLYDDGRPGELFITVTKDGSTLAGLVNSWAIGLSMALQYGVPLEDLVRKFKGTRFEPSGSTDFTGIRFAKSIVDYVARWLEVTFLSGAGVPEEEDDGTDVIPASFVTETTAHSAMSVVGDVDAPLCPKCGTLAVRSGNCHKCVNCGESLGCS